MRKAYQNLKEPSTGKVHICSTICGGEYTMCGWAFDAPSSEWGDEMMVDTDEVCTCEECIKAANRMLPVLRREMAKVKKAKPVFIKDEGEEKTK